VMGVVKASHCITAIRASAAIGIERVIVTCYLSLFLCVERWCEVRRVC